MLFLDATNKNHDGSVVLRFPNLLDWWTRTAVPLPGEGRVTTTTEERERHRVVNTESVEGGGTFFG